MTENISHKYHYWNIFSQVDEEGNEFVLFDDIVDHRVDRTNTMHHDAFILWNIGREETKGDQQSLGNYFSVER